MCGLGARWLSAQAASRSAIVKALHLQHVPRLQDISEELFTLFSVEWMPHKQAAQHGDGLAQKLSRLVHSLGFGHQLYQFVALAVR